MRKNKMYTLLFCTVLLWVSFCSTGKVRKSEEKSLVSVAIVKLLNASKQSNYDYLSESLTDATQTSMEKKFVYYHVPGDQLQGLSKELFNSAGNPDDDAVRSEALKIDADLVIYGYYTTTAAKKGDNVEIAFKVLRTDKGTVIAKISRNAAISARIFNDIENIAAAVVSKIADYRAEQIRESGIKDEATANRKIQFTKESISIAPFIPPAF